MNDSNSNDKRELLKLKQGLITQDESQLEIDTKPQFIKPTGKAAVSNFVYHHKLYIKIAAFFLVVATVFVYFALTAKKADITIVLIADTEEVSHFFMMEAREFGRIIEMFVPDFDSNGYVHADCRFIDLVKTGRNPDMVHGNAVKLFGEVQGGDGAIFIGNLKALENIPESAGMPVEDFYGKIAAVKDTALANAGNFERVQMPLDLYIAVRKNADENSLIVAENIMIAGQF
jgi:hypothetical protein